MTGYITDIKMKKENEVITVVEKNYAFNRTDTKIVERIIDDEHAALRRRVHVHVLTNLAPAHADNFRSGAAANVSAKTKSASVMSTSKPQALNRAPSSSGSVSVPVSSHDS
jgi:hypothetical protein